ncbi:phage holin [Escherichia coli]|uniref:phage holin n=1 Tax=Escherichia coli TaxID=562 RepID=UPI000CDE6F9A|nr:phage holin [Escherichia coli]
MLFQEGVSVKLRLPQLLQLLDKVSPSQWVAIGVLGSLLFGLLTYLTNLYFKIKEDKRKVARGE